MSGNWWAPGGPVDGETCPRVFIPAHGNHACTCRKTAGHVAPHVCPECGVAWTLASEEVTTATATKRKD